MLIPYNVLSWIYFNYTQTLHLYYFEINSNLINHIHETRFTFFLGLNDLNFCHFEQLQ